MGGTSLEFQRLETGRPSDTNIPILPGSRKRVLKQGKRTYGGGVRKKLNKEIYLCCTGSDTWEPMSDGELAVTNWNKRVLGKRLDCLVNYQTTHPTTWTNHACLTHYNNYVMHAPSIAINYHQLDSIDVFEWVPWPHWEPSELYSVLDMHLVGIKHL